MRQMAILLIVAGLSAALLPLLVFSRRPGQQGSTSLASSVEITSDNDRVHVLVDNLGIIEPEAVVQREVVIRNTSTETWSVRKLRADCSCTAQKLDPSTIGPDGAAKLSIEYRAGKSSGAIGRSVVIDFKEATAPRIKVLLTGTIRSWAESRPQEIRLGEVVQGERAQSEFELLVYEPWLADMGHATSDILWVTFKTVGSGHPFTTRDGSKAARFRALMSCSPPKTRLPGTFSGALHLQSLGVTQKSLDVRYTGIVVVQGSLIPSQFFFGRLQPGSHRSEMIELTLGARVPTVPLDAIHVNHSLGDELTVGLEPTTNPRTFSIRATFEASQLAGLRSGSVKLLLPGNVTFDIPVRALVVR